MASNTSTSGTLTNAYDNHIGTPSTDDEARGYWIILAGDGQGYADRSGMWDGIESMKRHAPNAGLEEVEGFTTDTSSGGESA